MIVFPHPRYRHQYHQEDDQTHPLVRLPVRLLVFGQGKKVLITIPSELNGN